MTISETLAGFARDLTYDSIPARVRERAKHLILDGVGIAHAATNYDFAARALAALKAFGTGDSEVIGLDVKLSLRDAALMNGILIHGIDYDDTYLPGGIHATASAFPCALGMATHLGLSGRDVLTAYVVAMEVSCRLSAVAKGEIHQVGFHPTGLMAGFGCAVAAGKLLGLDAAQLTMAQGIASSTASGSSREYSEESAWNKRVHPGWACVAGFTSAMLAKEGFIGPKRVYEGRYGLFPSFAGPRFAKCDLALATVNLGGAWEIDRVAVKPYPIGQLGVSSIDAAITIARDHNLKASDIVSILVLVPKETVPIMLEPMEKRRRPPTGYAAQFSLPYAIASSFVRGRFALGDLDDAAIANPEVLALIDKIRYDVDPNFRITLLTSQGCARDRARSRLRPCAAPHRARVPRARVERQAPCSRRIW